MFSDLFERTLGDLQCLQSRFQILTRMSSKKFAALYPQTLHDLLPLFSFSVRRRVWLVANLSTKARVLESLLDGVLSDLERKDGMAEVFIPGFITDSLYLPLKPFELPYQTLQLILLGLSQLSHSSRSSFTAISYIF
jgi:hypothetical protein